MSNDPHKSHTNSPYSEAADHDRRDREPRRPEGCAGVLAYLVIVWLAVAAGGVWIWIWRG